MAILPASGYDADLGDVVSRGLDLLDVSVRGRRVFLKPNMVEYESDLAINTHPHLIAAAATAFLRAGAREVVVGEGPGHRRDVEYLLDGDMFVGRAHSARGRPVDHGGHPAVAPQPCIGAAEPRNELRRCAGDRAHARP